MFKQSDVPHEPKLHLQWRAQTDNIDDSNKSSNKNRDEMTTTTMLSWRALWWLSMQADVQCNLWYSSVTAYPALTSVCMVQS